MPQNILSVRPGSYGPHALIAYEHLPEIGIKYVEIDSLHKKKEAERLKELLEDLENKIAVGSFNFPVDTDDKKIVEKFRESCELGKEFNPFVYFCSAKTSKNNFSHGYEVLRQLGDIAKEFGTILSLETHPPFCSNADKMLETMKNVNHPNVRINFDTANIYYYNKLESGDGIKEMEKVKQYVASVHLKESNGKPETWWFPPLGTEGGIVDFKKIFEMMNSSGFYGPWTLELEGTKEKPLKNYSVDEAKKGVERSVQHLRNLNLI
jgi:sugar phosphate isomerase/epimerase